MSEYDFHSAYSGPLGPHLNHLSRYTVTRKDEHRLIGRAIRGAGENTCKPPNGARQRRVIAALTEHLERHPRDQQSKTRLASLVKP